MPIAAPFAALFDFIGRHATRFMFFGVLLGLAFPTLGSLLKPYFIPLLLLPLIFALVQLDWAAFQVHGRRPLMILGLFAFLQFVCPVMMALALRPTGLPLPLVQAVVLMAAAPPIISAAAISLILGLDTALAVIVIVLATALVPFTLPPLALGLLGIDVEMSLVEFSGRLALLVGIAFAAALMVRKITSPAWRRRNGSMLSGLSVFNLVLFAIAIMDGVTDYLLARPVYVLTAALLAFAANLVLQGLGYAAGRWLFRLRPPAAATLALLAGNCNMGLVMVALADKAGFEMVIFFAMGQLPMYMLPALLYPFYRRVAQSAPGGPIPE